MAPGGSDINTRSKQEEKVQVEMIKTIVMQVISAPDFISTLAKSIAEVLSVEFKDRISNLEQRVDNLEIRNQELLGGYSELIKYTDSLEQYSRRSNIRIFGVPEASGQQVENTTDVVLNLFSEKLSITMNTASIDRCHRLRSNMPNKPRPIIVKFMSYRDKHIIFSAKKKFKSTPIVVREDLTPARAKLLHSVIERAQAKNVWTLDGNIFAFVNDRKVKITSKGDLDQIFPE